MFTLQMCCNTWPVMFRSIVLRAEIQKQAVHNRTFTMRESSMCRQAQRDNLNHTFHRDMLHRFKFVQYPPRVRRSSRCRRVCRVGIPHESENPCTTIDITTQALSVCAWLKILREEIPPFARYEKPPASVIEMPRS